MNKKVLVGLALVAVLAISLVHNTMARSTTAAAGCTLSKEQVAAQVSGDAALAKYWTPQLSDGSKWKYDGPQVTLAANGGMLEVGDPNGAGGWKAVQLRDGDSREGYTGGSFTCETRKPQGWFFHAFGGHRVTGDFWKEFIAYGGGENGIKLFGYPLTGEYTEDGRTVQRFERDRFELHPQNNAKYRVQFARYGIDDFTRHYGIPVVCFASPNEAASRMGGRSQDWRYDPERSGRWLFATDQDGVTLLPVFGTIKYGKSDGKGGWPEYIAKVGERTDEVKNAEFTCTQPGQ